MGADLSKLSDADLQALKAGDLSKVSDAGLQVLKAGQPSTTAAAPEATYADRLKSGAAAIAKGLFLGGPLGAATAGAGEGLKNLDDLTGKAGYAAGGKVTDLTGSPELGFATNVGLRAVPALLGGLVTKAAAAPEMVSGARWLMQSAVKPTSSDLLSGDAPKAVQTLLDEGINVTPAGMAELRRRITGYNKQVSDLIANSTGSVDKSAVAQAVNRSFNKFQMQVNPKADLAAIQAAKDEFLSSLEGEKIPVQLAQKIKAGTQQLLSDYFGSLSGAQYEAQKDLAHGLRIGIEQVEPSVAPLNAKQGALLNALSVTERHALMALNKNPAGLSLLAENPKAAVAFMADRSAAFKSLLARMLYSGRTNIPLAAGSAGEDYYQTVTQPPPQ